MACSPSICMPLWISNATWYNITGKDVLATYKLDNLERPSKLMEIGYWPLGAKEGYESTPRPSHPIGSDSKSTICGGEPRGTMHVIEVAQRTVSMATLPRAMSLSRRSIWAHDMGFRPLVRPHHSLQSNGFQSCMTTSNGHQCLLPYPSSRFSSSRLLPLSSRLLPFRH
jgi:hypothetical protein